MPITLKQIPGFSDVSDANFAAEQFALGINFARTVDNAKFGIVRPEVFVGRYINGDTVPLPTSPIDGYTYQRNELSYAYSFSMTGGTSTSSNGIPSLPGAIRYLAALIDQVTGKVSTYVEYLVGNGSAPAISNDGTLTVFTFATRRLTSLVVAAPPAYSPVLDSELATDDAVTESIMQRVNRNAKFAALNTEILYMGEFVNGAVVARPVSPADGYQYSYAEVTLMGFWRWTTQGDQLTDPTDPNNKQVQDLYWSIDPASGAVQVEVDYYHNVNYRTSNGRLVVMAFCKRALPAGGLGAGVVDFVDLSVDLLSAGRPAREDVLDKALQNTRYAVCRTEFFSHGLGGGGLGIYGGGNESTSLTNGQYVPLPVSPIDGYQYSREELTYVFGYDGTGPGSNPRMYDWMCDVDQVTGLVSSTIVRVPNGGASAPSNDGHVAVMVIARRDHVSNVSSAYEYDGSSTGVDDVSALQNGGFDAWNKNTDESAQSWPLEQQRGTGYGAQAPGLTGGFAQRLGALANDDLISVMSSNISVAANDLRFFSFVAKPNGAGGTLSVLLHFYSAVGDTCSIVLEAPNTPPAGLSQFSTWVKMPVQGDTTVQTGTGVQGINGTLDFVPVSCRIEFVWGATAASYVDIDEATFISQIDPSVGQIAQRGSTSLAFFPALTFTVTDTTFTPNQVGNITRADGSITAVQGTPPTITGLQPSTSYVWYPYLDEATQTLESVLGDSGTPAWLQSAPSQAFYAAWYNVRNLPLAASPIIVTTQATPSGGGTAPPSGGSGGGGTGSGGYGDGGGEPTRPFSPYQPVLEASTQ